MPITNEEITRRLVEDVLNGADLSAIDEIIHPDYVYRGPGEELRGRAGFRALVDGYRTAFPDMRIAIDELLAVDDGTVLLFTLTGTHRGELLGNAATHRPVEVHGIVISRIRDGLVLEEWEILDRLTLLEQLGLRGVAT